MIDKFNRYVNNYDMNNTNIKFKYKHSLRVKSLNKIYAKLLNFSEEDIKLAEVIGLTYSAVVLMWLYKKEIKNL